MRLHLSEPRRRGEVDRPHVRVRQCERKGQEHPEGHEADLKMELACFKSVLEKENELLNSSSQLGIINLRYKGLTMQSFPA